MMLCWWLHILTTTWSGGVNLRENIFLLTSSMGGKYLTGIEYMQVISTFKSLRLHHGLIEICGYRCLVIFYLVWLPSAISMSSLVVRRFEVNRQMNRYVDNRRTYIRTGSRLLLRKFEKYAGKLKALRRKVDFWEAGLRNKCASFLR